MSDTHRENKHPITLNFVSNEGKDPRFTLQLELLKSSQEKVNHIDELRSKYMNFALVVFAGLYALGSKAQSAFRPVISVVLALMMVAFCLLDGRLHKISHQWQSLRTLHYKNIVQLINQPADPLVYDMWDATQVGAAQGTSLQRILFYVLIVGGLLSFLSFSIAL